MFFELSWKVYKTRRIDIIIHNNMYYIVSWPIEFKFYRPWFSFISACLFHILFAFSRIISLRGFFMYRLTWNRRELVVRLHFNNIVIHCDHTILNNNNCRLNKIQINIKKKLRHHFLIFCNSKFRFNELLMIISKKLQTTHIIPASCVFEYN